MVVLAGDLGDPREGRRAVGASNRGGVGGGRSSREGEPIKVSAPVSAASESIDVAKGGERKKRREWERRRKTCRKREREREGEWRE